MSSVETYVALRFLINSWRWKGVPFYIRAGKCMATTSTEVVVRLRQAPAVFTPEPPPENCFRFQVTPTQTIAITSFVKLPGDTLRGESVNLKISEHVDPHQVGADEELLTDALRGVATRFARQDYVEESWRIVDPSLTMRRRWTSTSREAGDPSRRVASRRRRLGRHPPGGASGSNDVERFQGARFSVRGNRRL